LPGPFEAGAVFITEWLVGMAEAGTAGTIWAQ